MVRLCVCLKHTHSLPTNDVPINSTLIPPPTDVPIWSKLATGRIPNAQELFTMIDNQNKFYGNDLYGESMHTIPGHPAL